MPMFDTILTWVGYFYAFITVAPLVLAPFAVICVALGGYVER